jgi:apolipoprotein N-acyltransferase
MSSATPAAHTTGRASVLSRSAHAALALLGGALVALSLPPWGWWPLAFVGLALFDVALGDAPTRAQRFRRGAAFGAGWMYLGMGWMTQLSVAGYLAAAAVFACYHGVAALVAPVGRWSAIGRPAAHALAEALRFSFPFGGVPLASLAMGQIGGPLAGVARIGGALGLTWVTLQIGMAIPVAVRAWRGTATPAGARPAVIGAAVATVVGLLAGVAPTGSATGDVLRVAAVQGGGEQGTRALDVPSAVVTQRLLDATATISTEPAATGAADGITAPSGAGAAVSGTDASSPSGTRSQPRGPVPLDVVIWPENGVDVNFIPFAESPEADTIAAAAARLGVPILVGVTEDEFDEEGRRTGRYTNAQIVLLPDGTIVDRYDKVRRVPFGEYVPLRSLLERISSEVDQVGNAAPGGPKRAYLDLPDGTRLATVISWEVFFGGRAREGVRDGAEAIINPTNGASYTGTIVQTQQVASSRLRAVETGRWVVQVSPTGFSAFVSPDGEVVQRSAQREQRVLQQTIELRTGDTVYTRLGDAPIIAALLAAFAVALLLQRRERLTTARTATSSDTVQTADTGPSAHAGTDSVTVTPQLAPGITPRRSASPARR